MPHSDTSTASTHGVNSRWLAAMQGVSGGMMDIAALLRQVARHHQLVDGAVPPLELEQGPGIPDAALLRRIGVDVLASRERLRITGTRPWAPAWLRGDSRVIDLAISAPHGIRGATGHTPSLARETTAPPIDPFLMGRVDFSAYRGVGQREAVRAAVRCPDGEALYVVLPTGTGKSLVGQVRGLVEPARTTVVIVPTIALAMDQEREVRGSPVAHELPRQLAYSSDLPPEERGAIRRRLRDGDQRLLFTSPESAVGSLAPALRALAERGQLSTIVVDEAHMVRAWGEDFRAHFQLLPALRRGLVRAARDSGQRPPATLLMTATLTQDTYETLNRLFELDKPEIVSVSVLRPEPRYLLAEDCRWKERDKRLVEAVAHLPRPMIVYATEADECRRLAALLRAEGFLRVAAFNGDTPGTERRAILDGWTAERPSIDVVVGTSAFGLGVNLSDVRTVIHACIPESVDRYYQEVGRGGRDGHASVALLMPARGFDERTARGLARARLILPPKGFARWEAMRTSASIVDNTLEMRVDTIPPWRPDIDLTVERNGPRNEMWNRLTLNLMAEAGLLSLEATPPPVVPETDAPPGEWEKHSQEAFRVWSVTQRGHVRAGGLIDQDAWADATEGARQRSHRRSAHSVRGMLNLVEAKGCWRAALVEEYRLEVSTSLGPAILVPTGRCPGCPGCLSGDRFADAAVPSVLVQVDRKAAFTGFPMFVRHPPAVPNHKGVSVVTGPATDGGFLEAVRRTCRWAVVVAGLPRIVMDPRVRALAGDAFFRSLQRSVPRGWFVMDAQLGIPPFPLPSLVVVGPGATVPAAVFDATTSPRVLLCTDDAVDPLAVWPDHNRVRELHPTISYEELV